MAGKRAARLNEQFRREITGILRTQVRDPRIGVPTVTGVEVTPDLWSARVFVRPDPSILPGGEREAEGVADDLLAGLEAAAPYIRRELSGTLSLRRIPELRFKVDRSIEHAARIHALLAEVLPEGEEDTPGAEPGSGDAGSEGTDEGGEAASPGAADGPAADAQPDTEAAR